MRLLCMIIWALLAALPAQAGGTAGEFEYYVLSLSWQPNWCTETGDARRDPQCRAGGGQGFIVHGLWPQYKVGFPSDCLSTERDPSRGDTAAMVDFMGGAGLAFYEWKKHGRCTGLSSADYYAALRNAFGKVTVPPLFAKVDHTLQVPPLVVQDAFLESNPQLKADQITVTCHGTMIEEVRICLTKDLQPRDCGMYVVDDCKLKDAELDAIR